MTHFLPLRATGGPGVAHRQERNRHPLRHHLVTKGKGSQQVFAMIWQCQHGCLTSSPCPDSGFMTATCKAAPLPVTGHSSELGLNYHEPWLAWGLHNHRITNTAQRCSVYLRALSLARLLGNTARNQCKNNKEFAHPTSILETVHNPYICFLCFSKSSLRKSTTKLH